MKSGSLMNVRMLKRLSSKTEAVLRSNAYFIKYNLTLVSNPWSLYATLKFFKQQELSTLYYQTLCNVTLATKKKKVVPLQTLKFLPFQFVKNRDF